MNERTDFRLACRDGVSTPPVLRDVSVMSRLDGVLFEMTLRQTYRNEGTQLLELVYTFPLLPRAVLLGFAAELNGARQEGTILPRRQAERTYEEALAEGDAPVMLEAHADGLHSANIGNLKPGDEIVVEVRMAQLVQFEQGRLRLAMPATIAPRYGSAAQAGLQPQQAPVASLQAEYPLAFALQVGGTLADAAIDCPTHRTVGRKTPEGLRLELAPGARLDRDVVIVVTPTAPAEALVVEARDARSASAPLVLLAALPVPEAPERESVFLKLLVDCSGSMGGDSIASARRALNGVAARLRPADEVSFTRFGTSVQQASTPAPCSPATLARLAQDIAATDADLGGTEMQAALEAVFALQSPARKQRVAEGGIRSDVLLITDGEVWQVDEIIASARRGHHRVFVIGVGASPAEGALRRLAEATGGACEFATPGEALEAAAGRMLARIRQHAWTGLRVDWGTEAAWQGALPANAFAGDTLLAFAGVNAARASAVRLVARGAGGVEITLASSASRSVAAADALPRVAAAGRLAGLEPEAATALAVDYQLMSPHTNCVLVHQRAAADKAVGDAELQRVEGMLAAGWGASGSVMTDRMSPVAASALPDMAKPASPKMRGAASAELRRTRSAAPGAMGGAAPAAPVRAGMKKAFKAFLAEESESEQASSSAPMEAHEKAPAGIASPLVDLARTIRDHLQQRGLIRAVMAQCRALGIFEAAGEAIDAIVALGVNDAVAWALLVQWLDSRAGSAVFETVPDALKLRVTRLDPAVAADARAIFDRHLVAFSPA